MHRQARRRLMARHGGYGEAQGGGATVDSATIHTGGGYGTGTSPGGPMGGGGYDGDSPDTGGSFTFGLPGYYADAIKGFEGFDPKAKWDVHQYSYGYGTRAPYAGATITQEGANDAFRRDMGYAANVVDQVNPNLPVGTRAALMSLTHNTGNRWVNSGLGEAIRSGDWDKAKNLFMQYSHVAGSPNSAIANRRAQEAQWFGQGGTPQVASIPSSAVPSAPMQIASATPSAAPQIDPSAVNGLLGPNAGLGGLGSLAGGLLKPQQPAQVPGLNMPQFQPPIQAGMLGAQLAQQLAQSQMPRFRGFE